MHGSSLPAQTKKKAAGELWGKLGDRAAWGGALPFEVKDARQVEGAGVPKWSLKEF